MGTADRKNKNPAPFRARGLGSFDLGFVFYLRKPDSRAWLDGNKDEYENESGSDCEQRDRHVGRRGLEGL